MQKTINACQFNNIHKKVKFAVFFPNEKERGRKKGVDFASLLLRELQFLIFFLRCFEYFDAF